MHQLRLRVDLTAAAADAPTATGYAPAVDPTTPHQISSLPVRGLACEVIDGPDLNARATGDVLTIGTATGSDLRLTDPTVSRFHVELRRDDLGILVTDHGSTNGTYAGAVPLVEP